MLPGRIAALPVIVCPAERRHIRHGYREPQIPALGHLPRHDRYRVHPA